MKQYDIHLSRLLKGYRQFRREYYDNPYNQFLRELAREGQTPKIMVIGCSDSRVDPATIFRCSPGELFTVRNIANLVPPCDENPHHHATSAALEFAVTILHVKQIIILGHSGCGGIRTLLKSRSCSTETKEGSKEANAFEKSFVMQWMNIASQAKDKVLSLYKGKTLDEKAYRCEQEALKVSYYNLLTFPWIQKAIVQHALQINAWYFDLHSGELKKFIPDEDKFTPMAI